MERKVKYDYALQIECVVLVINAYHSCESVSNKGYQIAPTILARNFKASAPNQKWATDVTGFNISGKKLYLSPIIDLFYQEIISYELTEGPVFDQVVMMLKKHLQKYRTIEQLKRETKQYNNYYNKIRIKSNLNK